jgi:hypothetical protein
MQTHSHSEPGSQEREGRRKPCEHAQPPEADREQPGDLCHLGCGEISSERSRYYTGKYMTARDFQSEQDYFLSRHYMHNRLLHGWGIVCGLVVTPHSSPNCQDRYVAVSPGVAIDCCGREVVLRERKVIKIWDPRPAPKPRPIRRHEGGEHKEGEGEEGEEFLLVEQEIGPEGEVEGVIIEEIEVGKEGHEVERQRLRHQPTAGPYLLVLRYEEHGVEWVPALYAESACDPRQMEANRVQEIACIDVLEWDKNRYAGCWPIAEPDKEKERVPLHHDCDNEPDQSMEGCLEPACSCKYGIPLALVTPTYHWHSREWRIGRDEIDPTGRHELRTPPEYLTHIVDYNWTHGGTLRLAELSSPKGMDGKLRIYFDRRLRDDPDDMGTGINMHTFVVYYHDTKDSHYSEEVLFYDGTPPYLENDKDTCCAVFPIDPDLLEGDANLDRVILHVILKCDFILDCHGRPIDGEHLSGQTPTGDGHAGGTFESWFKVSDDEWEQRLQRNKARRQRERK